MHTETIQVDREQARELFQKYKAHQHYSTPLDLEIQRVYDAIAKGKVVIRAIASVAAAGLGEDKLPKLALARADEEWCHVQMQGDGGCRFWWSDRWPKTANWRTYVDIPAGSFPDRPSGRTHYRSMVPIVPVHMRPQRGLANYHVLYEAVWTASPPVDPLLVRRIGRADLWVVCAAWDLTEVERAVLAGRL